MTGLALQDRRILVVEDEFIVADAMERTLRRAGAIVLGPVPTVAQAMALIDANSEIDSAVLDINLAGHKVYPVVDRLLARGTRCVFATGNDPNDVPVAYHHVARCEKPVESACILSWLAGIPTQPSSPAAEQQTLRTLRQQVHEQIKAADDCDLTLIAAKLYEVLDAIEAQLAS
jgi:CheY-like chemotaxis protein